MLTLIRGILIAPTQTFRKIREGQIRAIYIHLIFWSTFLIFVIESVIFHREAVTFDDVFPCPLSDALSFLSVPLHAVLLGYLFYFILMALALGLCRKLTNGQKCKKMALMFMSASLIGLMVQFVLIIEYLMHHAFFPWILAKSLMLWNIILFYKALRVAGRLTRRQAIAILVGMASLTVLYPGGLTPLHPYLSDILGVSAVN